MSTFERVDVDGQVVERVVTIPNSHEDNRLGLAALEDGSAWRAVPETPEEPAKPAASNSAPAEKPAEATDGKTPKER